MYHSDESRLEIAPTLLLWTVGLAAVGVLLLAWLTGRPGPLESLDERQSRLDRPAPLPAANLTLEQSFVAQHNGLTAVELLLVVHQPAANNEGQPSVLTLRLLDKSGRQLEAQSWEVGTLTHNDPLRFAFPPLYHSAGQTYRLRLEGTAANQATVWAYSLDGYPRGELVIVNGERRPGDLRFQTFYRYSLPAAWRDLGQMATRGGALLVLALLLFLPGLALFSCLPALALRDPAARLGLALAATLAVLPLGWLWWTQLGGRVNGPLLWLALGGTALLITLRWRLHLLTPQPGSARGGSSLAILGLILLLGLSVRLLAVRDLVLPAWVDSPQHFLISRMMADSGTVPAGYRPWMPVDVFWYHFGFHALAASLQLMTAWPLEQILLIGGQMLNALAPLSVYTAAVLLTGRRRVGLFAAFLVALAFLFPAYYVTWGRYTQLTGMLVLAPFLGLVYRFFRRTGRYPLAAGLWAGLLLGGLFVIHARVWVFAIVWLLVVALGTFARRRMAAGLGLVMGLSVLCSLPWLLRVAQLVLIPLAARIGEAGGTGSYNDFPWGYLTYGWERAWLALAAVALLWALGSRYAPRRPLLLLGAWMAAVFALLNLGFPTLWLINNNTWYISLFVPVGILIGWLLDDRLRWAENGGQTRRLAAYGVLTAAVIWSGLFGLRQNVGVVNPETVLARPDDLVMLDWAEEYLPADALVAVNSWPWLGESNWAGSDGAYWLFLLTGRQSTMPPIGYGMERDNGERVNQFNRQLAAVEDWDAATTLGWLRAQGVTHILIGERGGPLRPEKLLASSHYRLLDSNGAAWLFEIVQQ